MKKSFHIILYIACALSAISARASDYLFSTLSLEHGLSQSTARSVLRDSRGFLWIGTKNGLNRFDCGQMECFFNDPDDASSIPDNDIIGIFEDRDGCVWIICEKGVATFDHKSHSFSRVEIDNRPLRVRSYFLRTDGVLFGGGGQLFFYDYDTRTVDSTPTLGGSNRYYTSIHKWGEDSFLLSTRWDGLWLYNELTGNIDRLGLCSDRDIMATHVDVDGNLWVSSYGDGLRCIDRGGRRVLQAGPHELGSGIVLDLLGIGDTLWVATDGGGIHTVDLPSRTISPLQTPYDKRQQSLRSVIKLYNDDYGYVYAGTVRDGITCITSSPMRTFAMPPGNEGMALTSLVADGSKIWIGVDGDGITLCEPDDGYRFSRFPSTAGMKITSLEDFSDNLLIFSTFDKGFFLFDKRTGSLKRAPAVFDEIAAANSRKALPLDIRRLPGSRVAVLSDRIYIIDLAKDNDWREISATLVNSHLNEFYTDYRSMLCFTEGEIIRFDIPTQKVVTLASVPDRSISCAAFDGDRYVYIGTSSGIKRLDSASGEIIAMPNDTPLPRRVTSLVFDGGRLWIGAAGAVFLKDFNTGRFNKFDRYDGVLPNEFIYKATLATPSRIYMGGVNGLLKIDRADVPDFIARKPSLPVRLTDIDVDGMVLEASGSDDTYTVPYGHSTISMRVDGGEPHPLRKMPFRFFINSPDSENPIETSDNTFSINRLSGGGRYDIYAQAVAPDGSWSPPRRVATLNVSLPWWRTPWAIFFYIIMSFGFIAVVFAYFIRRRRRAAEKRLAQYQRESLEKEVGFLMEMNHELRTPLTLIYARLKGMIDGIRQNKNHDSQVLDELENIYQSTRKMRDIINTTVDQWVKPENEGDVAPEIKDNDIDNEMETPDDTPVDLSEMSVIIAEHDPDLGAYIAENLRKIFGKVILSPDGKDAFTSVKNNNPDLIITDALLPGMSGADLCRQLKRLSEFSHIPIIMLTTRVEDMSLRGGHDLGADIYITKPFDMNQLAGRCRMVVRSFDRVKQRYKSNAADILPRDSYNNESETFLLKIKDVIEQNISHPGFGIDIIVEKMLMSRSSLYNKFKDLTGQSLGAYIEDYRITRAKEMLASTAMTMSEISDALGFSTQRYFSTFFRKKTGISPSQFRADGAADIASDTPATDIP